MSEAPRTDDTAVFRLVLPMPPVLDPMNALMTAWLKRRQEALETGLQALQAMAACRDPAAAARVCAEWMDGSLNRIRADVADARDHGNRMAELGQKTWQTMLSAQAAASAEVVAAAAKPADSSLRAAA